MESVTVIGNLVFIQGVFILPIHVHVHVLSYEIVIRQVKDGLFTFAIAVEFMMRLIVG
jgi:hypothetical protein